MLKNHLRKNTSLEFIKIKKNSITSNVVSLLNNKTFKTTFEIAKNLGNAFATYKEKGSKWALISGLGVAVLKLAEDQEVFTWDYFDDEWEVLLSKEFCGLVMSIVKNYPHEDICSDGSIIVRIHNVEGCNVGYTTNKKIQQRASTIYVKIGDKNTVEDIIKKAVWKKFKGQRSIVVRKNKSMLSYSDEDDKVLFEPDDYFKPLNSQRAESRAELYKKYRDIDMNRALLLFGPPGTGKSTMARSIVEKLEYRSFRVKLSDLQGLEGSTLSEAIKIFKPDALILDDLDRSTNQDDLLETLEIFHDQLSLVIATANNTRRFDRALLRPGRFDDIEFVDKLDDAVIMKVLGKENEDLFDQVKDWPICFVEDIRKRTLVMNHEDAMKSVEELAKRVEMICDDDNVDEWDTFVDSKQRKHQDHEADLISFEDALEEKEEDDDDDEGKD